MQPYFLPYIGYFQLIAAADVFILYDNIKYTKRGWINRNRMLLNGSDAIFSLPLKKASDSLDVVDRDLAVDFQPDKLLSQFKGAYSRAPFFSEVFPLLQKIVGYHDRNLFNYINHSIVEVCRYLGIKTEIRVSSGLPIDHELKSQDKVLALCHAIGTDTYINAVGGMELYSKKVFLEQNIELKFIESKSFEYAQFGESFIPWLSIVDVLMFNSRDVVCEQISTRYDFI